MDDGELLPESFGAPTTARDHAAPGTPVHFLIAARWTDGLV